MDLAKVSTVAEWPTPDSCKKVQQFLRFAIFYRRFIRSFSSVAAPLHALISSQVQFHWLPEAETAFQTLKRCFTSAPILTAFMLPGSSEDNVRQIPVVLVATYGAGGPGVCGVMFGLRQTQDVLRVPHGSLAAATHPLQTMVWHLHQSSLRRIFRNIWKALAPQAESLKRLFTTHYTQPFQPLLLLWSLRNRKPTSLHVF